MNQVKTIKMLCNMNVKHLYKFLLKFLYTREYKKIKDNQHYIIAEGDPQCPVCLIAHLDTVFSETKEEKEFIYDSKKQILWSPNGAGFDDRAGVFAIMSIVDHTNLRPSIIFTTGEEIGGVGATQLVTDFPFHPFSFDCKCLIELDRANQKDMVFYNCNNIEFKKYIGNFGFKEAYGSFSDISIIAPAWGIAAVNLSIGYTDEHTYTERLYLYWFRQTLSKVKSILNNAFEMPRFEYIQDKGWFDFNINRCFCCDKPFKDGKGIKLPQTEPYRICSECYQEYYTKDIFENS